MKLLLAVVLALGFMGCKDRDNDTYTKNVYTFTNEENVTVIEQGPCDCLCHHGWIPPGLAKKD